MEGKMDDQTAALKPKTTRLTVQEAISQVFSNDMLVEHILERAIRSSQGFGEGPSRGMILSKRDIITFRQVNKLWNRTVTKLHRQSQQPLFHLNLTHDNTSGLLAIEDDACEEEEELQTLLDKFIQTMSVWHKDTQDKESVTLPPFHLQLCPSFFRVANQLVYRTLFDFLSKYGTKSMTRFTFNFHRNRFDYIPTAETFPSFTFPNLKHIQLVIERMAWSFIPLIQKILEGSRNLETLDFTSSSCIVTYSVAHLSDTIESIARSRPYSLSLPENTKRIFLYGTVDSCSCFYKLPVDNLKKLETMSVSASACMIKQISDMFTPISGHLRNLHFVGFISCVYLFNRHYHVSFPPMPSLETLTVAMPWEMRQGVVINYARELPSLKELNVVHHDANVFATLLSNQSSMTVESCTVICIQPHVFADNGYRSSSQRMDVTRRPIIQSIRDAFPMLSHLGIGVNAMNSTGLEYVFTQMAHLRSLAIFVEANSKFKTTIHWDSLFTGLSAVACKSLMESQDVDGYWASVRLLDERYPSIRRLQDLESLFIIETTYPCCRAFSVGDQSGSSGGGHNSCDFERETLPSATDHIFSDISFQFSFLEMAKLKKLAVTRGFLPSAEIKGKWEQEKGNPIRIIKAPKLYHLLTAKFSLRDDEWYHEC